MAAVRRRRVPCSGARSAAGFAHLSLSTPESVRTHTVDFHHWVIASNAVTDIVCNGGTMTAPTGHGLGVAVDVDSLGDPLFEVH